MSAMGSNWDVTEAPTLAPWSPFPRETLDSMSNGPVNSGRTALWVHLLPPSSPERSSSPRPPGLSAAARPFSPPKGSSRPSLPSTPPSTPPPRQLQLSPPPPSPSVEESGMTLSAFRAGRAEEARLLFLHHLELMRWMAQPPRPKRARKVGTVVVKKGEEKAVKVKTSGKKVEAKETKAVEGSAARRTEKRATKEEKLAVKGSKNARTAVTSPAGCAKPATASTPSLPATPPPSPPPSKASKRLKPRHRTRKSPPPTVLPENVLIVHAGSPRKASPTPRRRAPSVSSSSNHSLSPSSSSLPSSDTLSSTLSVDKSPPSSQGCQTATSSVDDSVDFSSSPPETTEAEDCDFTFFLFSDGPLHPPPYPSPSASLCLPTTPPSTPLRPPTPFSAASPLPSKRQPCAALSSAAHILRAADEDVDMDATSGRAGTFGSVGSGGEGWWKARERRRSGGQGDELFLRPAGAIIFPPLPAYYIKPECVDDLTNQTVGRMLDSLGIHTTGFSRWSGSKK